MSDADTSASGAPPSEAAAPAPAPTPAPAAGESGTPAPAPTPAPADGQPLLGGEPAKDGEPAPAADATKPEEKKDATTGAPEAYADFTMPDGIELNGEVADSFKAFAKEHGLSQEKAQQVAELGAKLVQDTQAKHQAMIQTEIDGWKTASSTDKEFGGDALAENLAGANKALATFGSPELVSMLRETGLGNHPEVIRLLWKVSKEVSEDRFVNGKAAGNANVPAAQRMYPNMNP